MDAVTVNHATQNLNHLIGQVISNVEPTIICNDKGERALLMSMDEFNSWQETLYLLSNPANAEHLRESIAQAKMGKTQERELIEPLSCSQTLFGNQFREALRHERFNDELLPYRFQPLSF